MMPVAGVFDGGNWHQTGDSSFHRNSQETFELVVGTATDTVCNTVGVIPAKITLVKDFSPQVGAGSF